MILPFVILLAINNIISNVQQQVHGLKLTPVQRTTQKVDITDEVKIISVSVQNAYSKIKQHEVALVDPLVTLKTDEIIQLSSLINRWHMMEEKLQIPTSIIESKLKEITIYDEINYHIALGKVLVGNLLLKSREYDLAISELSQACANLWSYKAITYQNLETNGWLDCYSSLFEIYKYSNNEDGILKVANHLSKNIPWLSIILKKEEQTNELHAVASLELFHNLRSNEREIIGKSISSTWFVANVLRKKFQLLLHDFLNASKRIQLSIYLKAQKLFESVVLQYQEDFSMKISLDYTMLRLLDDIDDDHSQIDIVQLQKHLVLELEQENIIYLTLMSGILDKGEAYLQELSNTIVTADIEMSGHHSSLGSSSSSVSNSNNAIVPMLGFHNEANIITLFFQLIQKIQEKESENYRKYHIEDSDVIQKKQQQKERETTHEDTMRGTKKKPTGNYERSNQSRKKKNSSGTDSSNSNPSSGNNKKSKRSNTNQKEIPKTSTTTKEPSTNTFQSNNNNSIDLIRYFYIICGYISSITCCGTVYIVIAAIGGYYVRNSKAKTPLKSNKRNIPVIPNLKINNTTVTSSNHSTSSTMNDESTSASSLSANNYMVEIRIKQVKMFIKLQQENITIFNNEITWKTLVHTSVCLKLLIIFLYTGTRYLIELLYNYMFMKDVNVTGIVLQSNNTLDFVNELDLDYVSKKDMIHASTTSASSWIFQSSSDHLHHLGTQKSHNKHKQHQIKTKNKSSSPLLEVTKKMSEEVTVLLEDKSNDNNCDSNVAEKICKTLALDDLNYPMNEEKQGPIKNECMDDIKPVSTTCLSVHNNNNDDDDDEVSLKEEKGSEDEDMSGIVPIETDMINSYELPSITNLSANTTSNTITPTLDMMVGVSEELPYRDDWKNSDYDNYYSQEDKEGEWIVCSSSSNHHHSQKLQPSKHQSRPLNNNNNNNNNNNSNRNNDKYISSSRLSPKEKQILKPMYAIPSTSMRINSMNKSVVKVPTKMIKYETNSTASTNNNSGPVLLRASTVDNTPNESILISTKPLFEIKPQPELVSNNNNDNKKNKNMGKKQLISKYESPSARYLSEETEHSSLSDNTSEVTSLDGSSSMNIQASITSSSPDIGQMVPNMIHPDSMQASMMYLSMMQQQQQYYQQQQLVLLPQMQQISNTMSNQMLPSVYQPHIVYNPTQHHHPIHYIPSNPLATSSEDSSIAAPHLTDDSNNCGETTHSSGSGQSLSIQIPAPIVGDSNASPSYMIAMPGQYTMNHPPSYSMPSNYYTSQHASPIMYHAPNMYYQNTLDTTSQQISPIINDDSELINAIQIQIEYYFSVTNLSNDKYFRKLMDSEGYVLLNEIAQFRRIKKLLASPYQIIMAIQQSNQLDIECLDIIKQAKGNKYLLYTINVQDILQTKLRCIENPKSWILI